MNHAVGLNAPIWLCIDSPAYQRRNPHYTSGGDKLLTTQNMLYWLAQAERKEPEDFEEPEPASGKALDEDCYREGRRE